MGCCSALNCRNTISKGYRMYRFPMNPHRRKEWAIHARSPNWKPGPNARLCEIHFEESQFEMKRADGKIKLKGNAIPTIFNVTKPPKNVLAETNSLYEKCDPPNIPKSSELKIHYEIIELKNADDIEVECSKCSEVSAEYLKLQQESEAKLLKAQQEAEAKLMKAQQEVEILTTLIDKKDKMIEKLKEFLTEDQIESLTVPPK